MQATNDAQIRGLLLPFIHREHNDSSDTLVIEEFSIYGGANRADVAALNGISHGYEIKSDRDTLERLPQQVSAYGAIFERATLVSGERHLKAARKILPKWWGIVEVVSCPDGRSTLERIRESKPNPKPHPESIAALLWRSEALELLTRLGLDNGVRSKSMEHLTARLALEVPVDRLSIYAREALRARGDWRSAARLRRCDDTSRQTSNQLSFRRTPYGNIFR